jgi:hypothetical protein
MLSLPVDPTWVSVWPLATLDGIFSVGVPAARQLPEHPLAVPYSHLAALFTEPFGSSHAGAAASDAAP